MKSCRPSRRYPAGSAAPETLPSRFLTCASLALLRLVVPVSDCSISLLFLGFSACSTHAGLSGFCCGLPGKPAHADGFRDSAGEPSVARSCSIPPDLHHSSAAFQVLRQLRFTVPFAVLCKPAPLSGTCLGPCTTQETGSLLSSSCFLFVLPHPISENCRNRFLDVS